MLYVYLYTHTYMNICVYIHIYIHTHKCIDQYMSARLSGLFMVQLVMSGPTQATDYSDNKHNQLSPFPDAV